MTAEVIIARRRALLVTAVLALLLGLVGMHQLAITVPSHAGGGIEQVMAAGADHQSGMASPTVPAPHDEHGMLLHLCLAVLAAIGLLLLVLAVSAISTPAPGIWGRHRFSRARGGPRAPPRPVAWRLAQLCVLRS